MENIITYGLSSLYYALKTAEGYSAPRALPGAVKIDLTPESYPVIFTGLDGIPRTKKSIVYGYKGTLVIAGLPPAFLEDIYGYVTVSEGDSVERVTSSVVKCALLFETDGVPAERRCYYSCEFERPTVSSETKTDTVTVSTVSVPVIMRADSYGNICRRNSASASELFRNWFRAVPVYD